MARPSRKPVTDEPPVQTLRSAKDALYRQHIIEAAEATFAEQGFEATHMRQIAQRAGISLGTLYGQFDGKQALYRAVLIARDTEMLGSVQAQAAELMGDSPSLPLILQLMEVHLRYLLEHPNYLKMQLQQGTLWYHSSSRPSESERELWETGMRLMEGVFEWGIKAKVFIPQAPDEMVSLLLSLQQTRLSHWMLGGCQASADSVLAVLKGDFVRFFCTPDVARQWLDRQGRLLKRHA